MDSVSHIELRLISSVAEIQPDLEPLLSASNPFTQWHFLQALESSGVVHRSKGWQPLHFAFYDNEKLIAFIPHYIKSHSYGEFVFDWAWAEAYHRHGLDYYPKSLTGIPLSPVTGPRFFFSENVAPEVKQQLIHSIIDFINEQTLSSWHINFLSAKENLFFDTEHFIKRFDIQFHWHNQNYQSFEDFLASLKQKKRKNILRERRIVAQEGWTFESLSGHQMNQQLWTLFFKMYQKTFDKKGNWAQLNLQFFLYLSEHMPDNILLIFACKNGEKLAGALFLHSQSHLYGRYWGAIEESPGLHFETCYYQGIDYAIKQGLECFEPGAQGEHKLARGFLPRKTYSYHYIKDKRFAKAIGQSVSLEADYHQQSLDYYAKHSPYKKD